MDLRNEDSRTYYLVDSENIGDAWVNLIDTITPGDRIVVFYTDNSMHIGCEKVRRLLECEDGVVRWISCVNGTKNALDFQLVTELGAMIARGDGYDYVIVSNDSGFDAVVSYWQRNQVSIRKMRESECVRSVPAATEHSMVKSVIESGFAYAEHSGEMVAPIIIRTSPSRAMSPTEAGLSSKTMTVLSTLCKSIPIEPSTLLNNALNLIFTPKEGAKIYNKLKQLPEYRQMLTKKLLPKKSERYENYINLVLKVNKLDTTHEREIFEILMKNSKNDPNTIRGAFVKKFGEELGVTYFKVLKRHFAVLKRI